MFLRLGRLFRSAGREMLVLWYASRNPSTPKLMKLATVLLMLYVISPIDLIPDWIPVLGWLDDVTVLAFGVPALMRLLPQPILAQAHAQADALLSRLRFGLR